MSKILKIENTTQWYFLPTQLASIFEMLLPNIGKDNTNPTLWYNAVVSVNFQNPVEHTDTHLCVCAVCVRMYILRA